MSRLVVLAAALTALPLFSGCAIQPTDDEEIASDTTEALAVHEVDTITTISYAPNSYVIGNAYPGWTDDVQGNPQFSSGPGNPNGVSYRWGYLFGEGFDRCAWIADGASSGSKHETGSKCGSPQEIDTPYFLAEYTNGIHNALAGDGSVTHMHYAGSGCTDRNGYGNVEPWKVPATPHNEVGPIPDGRELRWRYVSKDGHWVLVREPGAPAGQPSWFFVHRGCVSLANTN
jgi:hypothetical protein